MKKCKYHSYSKGMFACNAGGFALRAGKLCYSKDHIKCLYYIAKEKENKK